jgi:DNA topoisomerase VI subunit B
MARAMPLHPKSLNNISLSHLVKNAPPGTSLAKFLATELNGISPALASRIAANLSLEAVSDVRSKLTPQHIAALCQTLRDEASIKPPSASCLSPAGEYNVRLGVLKEMCPTMVATFTDKPGVYEGHPFLVEAAVSLGGNRVREGINVFRFANRIPMLFESGADVITQVGYIVINFSHM